MKKFVLIFVLAVHAVRCISMYQYVNEQGEQCVCATTGDPDMYDNSSIDLPSSERTVDSCEYRPGNAEHAYNPMMEPDADAYAPPSRGSQYRRGMPLQRRQFKARF